MGAQTSAIRDQANQRGVASTLVSKIRPAATEARRFYEETVRLCDYSGQELVARDSTALFLDWDDTLFPSTWVQKKQRACKELGKPFLPEENPNMRALADQIISFLCKASRIGHVILVTSSAPNFIQKCCRICFPKLLPVFDGLKVTVVYARPQYHEVDREPVEMWKEIAYSTVLQGRSIRPLVPALARFYDAPKWSHILAYSDDWGDHAALRRAVRSASPESVLKVVKARPAEVGLGPDAISKELKVVGQLLQHVASVEVDFPFDMGDVGTRALVEEMILQEASASTKKSTKRSSKDSVGSDSKSNMSSASTSLSNCPPSTITESTSSQNTELKPAQYKWIVL
jgi:hypothetical protein